MRYREIVNNVVLFTYRKLIIPILVVIVRLRRKIDVVFVISELGVWKTERLYKKMLSHPRFCPHIVVVDSTENASAKKIVIDYFEKVGYDYLSLLPGERIKEHYRADIILYQKPYSWVIPESFRCRFNWTSLFCFVTYGFSSLKEDWSINQTVQKFAWQLYYENESVASELSEISVIKGENIRVTGIPTSDEYLDSSIHYDDPWKKMDGNRKRVIWAPHHTIPTQGNWLDYSTFLDYSEIMVDLARKYKESVQFAFKPHPLLRPKLEAYWGKEKTDAYFLLWQTMENTQLEQGEYVGLFKYSDAMIHDCGSFTIEYHFTHNPVMYLENGRNHINNMVSYAKEAYDLHYKGRNIDDVETFINQLFSGDDPLKARRDVFVNKYLVPSGLSACDNIIDEILGR